VHVTFEKPNWFANRNTAKTNANIEQDMGRCEKELLCPYNSHDLSNTNISTTPPQYKDSYQSSLESVLLVLVAAKHSAPYTMIFKYSLKY